MGKFFDNGAQFFSDRAPRNGRAWKPNLVLKSSDRDDLIKEYWGIIDKKFFPIADSDLLDMMDASGKLQKVMICVESITDPVRMHMKWMPFDKNAMNAADDYYVINASFISGNNVGDPTGEVPDGIIKAQGDFIVATVGKKGDNHFVIINQATCILVNSTGGTGDPPGVGGKIPTG
jgi:hypothetical protein